MKYLTTLLLVGLFCLPGCDTDEEACYECDTQVVTIPQGGTLTATHAKARYCGKTDEEIQDMETAGTSTVMQGTTEIQTTVTCTKK